MDRGAVLEYRWSCDLAASAFNSFSLAASLSSSMFCWHVSAHLLRVDQSLAFEQSLDVLHVIHSLLKQVKIYDNISFYIYIKSKYLYYISVEFL
jgi:hypothetical protein